MKWNKKGAIELSITTIVVLIIALAVLAVAILLINMIREKATGVLEQQFKQLETEALDCIKGSGNVFCSKLISNEIKRGEPVAMAVGVRNTAASKSNSGKVCFRMQVKCLRPFASNEFCDAKNQQNDITVGGVDYNKDEPSVYWFTKANTQGETDLAENEAKTLKAELQVKDVKSGSYEMEVNVYKANNDKDCNDAEFTSDKYASEGFTIKVE